MNQHIQIGENGEFLDGVRWSSPALMIPCVIDTGCHSDHREFQNLLIDPISCPGLLHDGPP